jgi:ABC-2 type transport system permease protein
MFAIFLLGRLFDFNIISSTETGLNIKETFLFLMSGISLQIFSDVGLWGPVSRVENDVYFGTLETVFVSPASRIAYLLSPTISETIVSTLFFLPHYLLALAINGALMNFRIIGWTLLVSFLTILSLMGFGLFLAVLAIRFRQTNTLAFVLFQVFQFLCGLFVPVQAFISINPVGGRILQYFAMIFPYTYCYDLMRHYMLGANFVTLLPVWVEFVVIICLSVLFVVAGAFTLKFIEKKAKKSGLAIL